MNNSIPDVLHWDGCPYVLFKVDCSQISDNEICTNIDECMLSMDQNNTHLHIIILFFMDTIVELYENAPLSVIACATGSKAGFPLSTLLFAMIVVTCKHMVDELWLLHKDNDTLYGV